MQSILNQQQPGLKKFFTASVVLHIIVIAVALFLIKAEPSRVLSIPSYTTVELVGQAPGRAAPKARRRAKKIAPARSSSKKKATKAVARKVSVTKKKTSTKKVILPDETKTKTITKELDPVSSAILALEKKAEESEQDEFIADAVKEIEDRKLREKEARTREVAGLREEILSGAVIDALSDEPSSAGYGAGLGTGAGSGSVNISQMDIAFIEYYNSVGAMIRSEWIFPGDAVPGLQTIIAIKIAPDGKVLALRVEKASGNTLFDQSAIKAVEKVGDFPPLPKDVKEEFLDIGIRFCPGGCTK